MSNYNDGWPDRGMFWLAVKWMAFIALLSLIAWLFVIPLFVGGRMVNRQAQKFDAETSAQVYDNSRSYQQGINRDVARYCRDWQLAEGPAKRAVADLIRSTTETYQGNLTPSNQACLADIEGN